MKKWTRAGLNELVKDELQDLKPDSRVLSVGGHGPVNDFLRKMSNENKWTLITLDIDPLHSPEILIDLADLTDLSSQRLPLMDAIVCIEVRPSSVVKTSELLNVVVAPSVPEFKYLT